VENFQVRERVLRRKREEEEEEEEDWRESVGEPGCGLWDLLGRQIIKLMKGTAPEKPCYWAWAHGHLFFSPYYYY